MPRKKKEPPQICVVDSETDPFKFDREPVPFCWGFWDGLVYLEFWDCKLTTCTEKLLDYLISRKKPLIIYAHNGGKFDFFFFLEHGAVENPALIINGRITKAAFLGIHEIRDSYSMMPVALKKMVGGSTGNKLDIEYWKMEKEVRFDHQAEISQYLKADCTVLYEYVVKFRERFGDKLTVGGAAIGELGKLHPVSRQNTSHDMEFRKFYFGGRVECFEGGVIEAPPGMKWKIHDVNSMYPKAMHSYDHPMGAKYLSIPECEKVFNKRTGELKGFAGLYFIHFTGRNKNAIPKRDDETGNLRFDIEQGEFWACSHEVKVAIELGLLHVDKIHSIKVPFNFISFKEFVDFWMLEKIAAQNRGDEAGTLFAKLILNSAYGKYGSNANEFKEWFIFDYQGTDKQKDEFEKWRQKQPVIKGGKNGMVVAAGTELVHDYGRFEIWQAPNPSDRGFFDVAVASSITSAARSMLLRAIHHSTRPLYCDTDSLVSLELSNVDIHDTALGAWKFEGSTSTIYIGGKKLYTCTLDQPGKDGKPKHKSASKGAHLTHEEIIRVCKGEIVHWKSEAPNFKFSGQTKFVARNIRKNVKEKSC